MISLLERMIRAKVGAEQEVFSGNDINGYPIQWIQYDIKQIKMFKGPAHDIEAIFTVCGVPLEANGKKEYLIAGKAEADGKMLVTLCDLIMPWDTMSSAQQRSLNLRYQMGCECKITWCLRPPCSVSAPAECIWTDWVSENKIFGQQAKYLSCIKRADGSCSWTAAWPRPRRHGPTQ
ncbi:hypothetical protein AAFF_G00315110 [Aldrovandia affinis]|uniref:Metalloproteinase inhibitor 2 n=1 Tax=Aldrovandia affinis TaxID=143900 RepID=A0AAD7W0X3_9TELE|nr:hypothetical protein AAFF_G00315110 [Aldrovandia affinis]